MQVNNSLTTVWVVFSHGDGFYFSSVVPKKDGIIKAVPKVIQTLANEKLSEAQRRRLGLGMTSWLALESLCFWVTLSVPPGPFSP